MPFLVCKPFLPSAAILRMRDPVSGLLHVAAGVAAIAGLVWLVALARERTPWHVASFAVFGVSMVLLYGASSLYHLLPVTERLALLFRRLDHSMIYVFIAGSYTPVCLVALRGPAGAWTLGVIWAVALVGVGVKLLWLEPSRWFRVGLYLALGWASVAILPLLLEVFPASGFAWLGAGGGAYTVGSVVYATRRPDPLPRVFGFHEIWHLCVIAGSACHFCLMQQVILHL